MLLKANRHQRWPATARSWGENGADSPLQPQEEPTCLHLALGLPAPSDMIHLSRATQFVVCCCSNTANWHPPEPLLHFTKPFPFFHMLSSPLQQAWGHPSLDSNVLNTCQAVGEWLSSWKGEGRRDRRRNWPTPRLDKERSAWWVSTQSRITPHPRTQAPTGFYSPSLLVERDEGILI